MEDQNTQNAIVNAGEAQTEERQAKKPEKPELVQWVESKMDRIAEYCTHGVSAQQLCRTMATAYLRDPESFNKCTRESIILAITAAARLGLDPTGDRNSAHFIAYKDSDTGTYEMKLMIGYGGFITLILRNSDYIDIQPEVVYRGEKFEVHRGTRNEIVHEIDMDIRNAADPEKDIIATYTIGTHATMYKKWDVLSRKEIDKARAASKMGSTGAWKYSFPEQAKKTGVRHISKWMDIEPQFSEALRISDDGDGYESFDPSRMRIANSTGGEDGVASRIRSIPKPDNADEPANRPGDDAGLDDTDPPFDIDGVIELANRLEVN